MVDLISRAAAIAEIEEYIEEYSELEPETGYHNLKWCAMQEAKDVLSMLPTVDAVPVEWLQKYTAVGATPRGDRLTEGNERLTIHRILNDWQKEQEAGE